MSSTIANLFFYVSGEHPTLTFAEVKAILQSEGFLYTNEKIFSQLLCLQASPNCLPSVVRRSSYTKAGGVELFSCQADIKTILQYTKDIYYGHYLKAKDSFSVRIKKLEKTSKINTIALEKRIGQIILDQYDHVNVNLSYPDVTFYGLIGKKHFLFGPTEEALPKGFTLRKPSQRPFFHPSALSPKLARCMINLARGHPDVTIFDPFCGTGSILIEAGLIGCRVVGSDVNPKMVKGCRRNLDFLHIPHYNLFIADARKLPLSPYSCVVTDPPYRRSSSTLGLEVEELVSSFLSNTYDHLPKGGYVSISLPTDFQIVKLGQSIGYMCVEVHFVREHKSLTREIAVFKKP
jgi:tRNA (guanine10-N2)-dimethyltransferase